MKKILILDVDSCYFCPCSSAEVGWLGNITRSVCQVKGEENTVFMDGVSGVPDWCPLKPLPKEEEPTDEVVELGSYNEGYGNGYECGFADGWNACLKEITGDAE